MKKSKKRGVAIPIFSIPHLIKFTEECLLEAKINGEGGTKDYRSMKKIKKELKNAHHKLMQRNRKFYLNKICNH